MTIYVYQLLQKTQMTKFIPFNDFLNRTLKDELPGSVGVQYANGDQWRNNSRKNKEMEPKQKQNPTVDVTSDKSKV